MHARIVARAGEGVFAVRYSILIIHIYARISHAISTSYGSGAVPGRGFPKGNELPLVASKRESLAMVFRSTEAPEAAPGPNNLVLGF